MARMARMVRMVRKALGSGGGSKPCRAAFAAVLMAGALGAVAASAAPAASLPSRSAPPVPVRWVTDGAGFLSAAVREELDRRLEAYQARTGHQVLVWIGGSTGGLALEDFTVRAFAAWRVGRKGSDDGLAIFFFADDRKVRFEVGYGLEGQVPDATASRIINEVILPRLKAGDRDGAVTAGVDATLAAIDGRPWGAGTPGTTAPAEAPSGSIAERGARGGALPPARHSLLGTILRWVLIAAVLLFLVTHPSMAMFLLFSILSGGRGGGGGWGDGGGGGFSGGGGRSGGGGASGSW